MSFSSSMSKTAKKLIDKYGNNVVVIHKHDCVWEPSLGENVCQETLYPYKASISNYSSQELQSEYVSVDDLKATIQSAVNIKKTDADEEFMVEYDGKRWKIINIEIVTTQDKIIIQKLQIRGVV